MWLIIALFARFIEGTSAVFDKKLLSVSYQNAAGYAFWIGILSIFAVVLIPFGFNLPPLALSAIAVLSGMLFFSGIFLYIAALSAGEVSGTNVLIGIFTPIATLFWSTWFLGIGLYEYQFVAFAIFILSGALLFFSEKPEVRLKVLFLVSGSAILLGAANTLSKYVFMRTDFISGFVVGRFGETAAALLFLLIPNIRRNIFLREHTTALGNIAYLFNRAYAACGSVLIYYAISLGVPAMVDATAAARYLFVFAGGSLWLRERFSGKVLLQKLAAFVLICVAIFIIVIGDNVFSAPLNPARPISWGVTFSQKFSVMMGLDWRKNYDAILGDLGAKKLRLIAYWDLIEKDPGQYDFSALDYQFAQAEKRNAKAILVVGERVPRWPECHTPPWAASMALGAKNEKLLAYMQAVVERYRASPALEMWQVENEPFLSFGECPQVDPAFLDKEIALVKSLDSTHKTLVTDSGELSLWYKAASRGDVFGTTMYRRVNNRVFGNIDYHLPPNFFLAKKAFSRYMTGDKTKKYIVVELGAEPWLHHQLYETALNDQLAVFDLPFFKDTVRYAKEAGFDEYYLWGAEWWYWMKEKHNLPEFWNYARSVITPTP